MSAPGQIPNTCPNCGEDQFTEYICPECGLHGCDSCMPGGVGVLCPECEEDMMSEPGITPTIDGPADPQSDVTLGGKAE